MTQKTIELMIKMWRLTLPSKFKRIYVPQVNEWASARALWRRGYARMARDGYVLESNGRALARWYAG